MVTKISALTCLEVFLAYFSTRNKYLVDETIRVNKVNTEQKIVDL